jgi:hypothetical protein
MGGVTPTVLSDFIAPQLSRPKYHWVQKVAKKYNNIVQAESDRPEFLSTHYSDFLSPLSLGDSEAGTPPASWQRQCQLAGTIVMDCHKGPKVEVSYSVGK